MKSRSGCWAALAVWAIVGCGEDPEQTGDDYTQTVMRESAGEPMLLHADLHQFNILSSGDRGWTAIDPKGAVGDPGYEVGPLIRNLLLACTDPMARLKDRLRRVSSETGLEESRVLAWAFAHSVLSTCWSVEDKQPWQERLACARLMAEALR
jgi:streptomycin 6-kinase